MGEKCQMAGCEKEADCCSPAFGHEEKGNVICLCSEHLDQILKELEAPNE